MCVCVMPFTLNKCAPLYTAGPEQRLVDKGLADLVPGCAQMLPDKLLTDCKGDAWLVAVANKYPDLTEIDISKCGAVTDRGLAQLASNCTKLLPDKIPSVSKGDRFLSVVAKMHPSLTEMNLRDCTAITDGFVFVTGW